MKEVFRHHHTGNKDASRTDSLNSCIPESSGVPMYPSKKELNPLSFREIFSIQMETIKLYQIANNGQEGFDQLPTQGKFFGFVIEMPSFQIRCPEFPYSKSLTGATWPDDTNILHQMNVNASLGMEIHGKDGIFERAVASQGEKLPNKLLQYAGQPALYGTNYK